MNLNILYLVVILFAFCSCEQTIDTRCSLYDDACQMNFLHAFSKIKVYTGIPEAHIPIIDPIELRDETVSVLGFVDVTLIEGEAEGIGKCNILKFETDVEARQRQVEVICDKITIRGHYKVTTSSIIANVCEWCNIHGEGNGTIIIYDWFFKFSYEFMFEKRDDGEIYFKPLLGTEMYESDEKNVTVEVDVIKSGEKDITYDVISFLNENWETIMDSDIGKMIQDKSAEYYFSVWELVYKNTPAKTLYKEDLNLFVTN